MAWTYTYTTITIKMPSNLRRRMKKSWIKEDISRLFSIPPSDVRVD